MSKFSLKAFNASPVARHCKARETAKTYFRNWRSMTAVSELAARRQDQDVRAWCDAERSGVSSFNNTPSHDWDFDAGIDGAAEVFRKGWKEGAQKLVDVIVNAPELDGRDFSRAYDVAGVEPDIDRFIAGEPEYMVDDRPKDTDEKNRVVRLFVPFNASCGWTAEQFANRGAAVLSIISALEQNGYAVELTTGVINGMTSGSKKMLIDLVPVKQPDQQLDVERIASALAHPAFFRRLWFTSVECDPRTVRMSQSGYGINYNITQAKFDELTKDIHELEGVTLIAGAVDRNNFNDLTRAIETLKRNNEKLAGMMGE